MNEDKHKRFDKINALFGSEEMCRSLVIQGLASQNDSESLSDSRINFMTLILREMLYPDEADCRPARNSLKDELRATKQFTESEISNYMHKFELFVEKFISEQFYDAALNRKRGMSK